MQTVRLFQALVLMLIVALAASCAATKEYTSKLFAPRNPEVKPADSSSVALRFLDLDNAEPNKEDWVTTDVIMGRDSSHTTFALDNFSKTFPANPIAPVKKDSINAPVKEKDGDARPAPILTTTKPVDVPMAKSYNPSEVRSKKSREEK